MTQSQKSDARTVLPVPALRIRNTWVRVIIGTICFVILLLGQAILGQALGIDPRPDSILVRLAQAAGVIVTVLLLTVAMQRWLDRRPRHELGLRLTLRGARQFLIGTIAVGGTIVLSTTVAVLPGWTAMEPAAAPGPWLAALPSALIAAYLAQGLPEEIFFRGYVFSTTRNLSTVLQFAVTSGSFGIIHIISGSGATNWAERLLYVVMACSFGFACTALRSRTDSIWIAVGGHGGFHLGNFVAGLFLTPASAPGTWLCWTIFLVIAGGLVLRKKPAIGTGRPDNS